MKILFINLCARENTIKKIPNVGLAYVVDATDRAGYKFEIIDIDLYRYSDKDLEEKIKQTECDIVAFGALASMYIAVRKVAAMARKHHPKAKIILGNTLATSVYQTVLKKIEVDICILGEGEIAFLELVKTLEANKPIETTPGIAFMQDDKFITTPLAPVIRNIDQIPFLNYELFNMEGYLENSRYHVASPEKLPIVFDDLKAIPINTARGCPFTCTFCTHAFKDYKYRVRSPENIIREMKFRKEQYGINFVNFWDELTFVNAAGAEEFADLLIKEDLGIYWIASVRSELFVKTKRGLKIAKKFKEAGCHGLAFSLESGNKEILKAMNKLNTVEDYIDQCNILQQAKVDIYTSIIIGFPQESPKTIDDTFDVLAKVRTYPSVGFLQLLPGTPLYKCAIDKGIITEEDYLMRMGDRQDLRINLTQYEDKEIIEYTTKKLTELNKGLKMGLDEENLIKTGVWQGKSKKDTKDG